MTLFSPSIGVIWTANFYIFEYRLLGLLIDMLDVIFCMVALAIMRSRQSLKISLVKKTRFLIKEAICFGQCNWTLISLTACPGRLILTGLS